MKMQLRRKQPKETNGKTANNICGKKRNVWQREVQLFQLARSPHPMLTEERNIRQKKKNQIFSLSFADDSANINLSDFDALVYQKYLLARFWREVFVSIGGNQMQSTSPFWLRLSGMTWSSGGLVCWFVPFGSRYPSGNLATNYFWQKHSTGRIVNK